MVDSKEQLEKTIKHVASITEGDVIFNELNVVHKEMILGDYITYCMESDDKKHMIREILCKNERLDELLFVTGKYMSLKDNYNLILLKLLKEMFCEYFSDKESILQKEITNIVQRFS